MSLCYRWALPKADTPVLGCDRFVGYAAPGSNPELSTSNARG